MSVKVATIVQTIEKIAPKKLAYDWDNVGLLVGNPKGETDKILVSLDVNEQVVDEAIELRAGMIISHHPLIFKPIKNILWDNPMGAVLKKLIQNEISVYAAHTNLDLCRGGVNQALFEKLGLGHGEILKVESIEKLFKFVVFVPMSHVEQVKLSMGNAGAGWIGNYSHCSFGTTGIGSFKPLEGSSPYVGRTGEIEEVEEMRLETIVPEKLLNKVLKAVIKAHPYEEVAYDLYPLANSGEEYGLGLIGIYTNPLSKNEFLKMLKECLQAPVLKIAGSLPEKIEKVGVCGGSGGTIINNAAIKGAQVFVTGDVSYHQAQEAENLGVCVIDAGHGITERLIVPIFASNLDNELQNQKANVEVIVSKVNNEPWTYI
ncbi:Nif3-like dinuclear metal center hexameric protein [Desulfitibacter alkalitolerans]|uniref:Nif3-like dinuclear metal center hexameric protein n=1 Tax=Desulfitibacter alkalitolerans TaxID=264641 RepID=UPI0004813D44|nr:Nif3-like dinuclear metal center hexameric protein [Desulfitibacter alkalitolerans]